MVLALWAPLALAQPFDPRDHDRQDLAYLQAALTLEGDYNGLLDGAWGRRSQSALDSFAFRQDKSLVPGAAHLRALVTRFESERRGAGWDRFDSDVAGVSVAQPMGLLAQTDRDSPHLTVATPSRDLLLRWIVEGAAETGAMHDWARQAHAGAEPAYANSTDTRLITAATLTNGRRVYLRSWRLDRAYMTLLIQSEPAQYRRAALIAASITHGRAPDMAPSPGGRLVALLSPPIARVPDAAPLPWQEPVAVPEPSPRTRRDVAGIGRRDPGLATGSGTGFFVNATDVVTAAHVIEGCTALTLEDGTPLSVVAADGAADLAVLQAEGRSAHWLPLRVDDALRLGQAVAAVGYPFLSFSGGALSLTMGNISAASGAGHSDWVSISAPVQPGNSGGPLLSDRGEVVGVVVARASDAFYLKQAGALPQNINYAVGLARLRSFLSGVGVALPPGAPDPEPLSAGLSEAKQAAIRPVMCY